MHHRSDARVRSKDKPNMGPEPNTYKGYCIWGHAIPQHDGYAASGTITKGTKLVESSGVLAACETEDEARRTGINWARAWVDALG